MDEKLSSKRYETPFVNLNDKNSSQTLAIDLIGYRKQVLEIGTSTGYVTKILKEHENIVTGIEKDREAGLIAKQYCNQIIIGDIEVLDLDKYLEPSSFDVILCGDLLEHLKEPSTLLKQIKKYLKPEGFLIASLPNFFHGDVLLNILKGDFRYTSAGLLDVTHLRFFGLKNIISLFLECGYEISNLQTTIIEIGNTELKVDTNKIPKELIIFISSLPNSNVYQFIFTAHPSSTIRTPTFIEPDFNQLIFDSFKESIQEIGLLLSQETEKNRIIGSEISRLYEEVLLKTDNVYSLNEIIQTKDSQISSLTKFQKEMDSTISILNDSLANKENQILSLKEHDRILSMNYQMKNQELDDIKNSATWHLVTKFHQNIIERFFAPGTRERDAYDRGLKRVNLLISKDLENSSPTSLNYISSDKPKQPDNSKHFAGKMSTDVITGAEGKQSNKVMILKTIEKLKLLMQNSIHFIKDNGIIAFGQRIRDEFRLKIQGYKLKKSASKSQIVTQSPQPRTVRDLLYDRFPISRPLKIYHAPIIKRRVNLVTDSINQGSLFGGVATAIIFSALLAERWGCDLRVITRTEKPNEVNFGKIIRLNNITLTKNVEFLFADINSIKNEVDISSEDVFLTTSWWTTKSVLHSVNASQIIYLLQEDERMFYPFSDDHLKCAEILKDPHIRYVINSKLLFDHFISEGFINIRKNGIWFEPSFNPESFHYDVSQAPVKTKKNIFFYARPNHPRNLFYLGLEVITKAIEKNIININEWDIYFAGKDIPPIRIGTNYHPIIVPNMEWDEYCTFIRSMDLGFSLMYTPHPSYPPLDLAASGAVVVTNRFGNKSNLDCYSKNIICKDTSVESLLEGLVEGISLAEKTELRLQNYKENNLSRDWETSFHDVISALENGITHV